MRSRIGFVRQRVAVNLATGGTAVPVLWMNIVGGTTDAGTGAQVDGTKTPLSGVMMAFGVNAPPLTVVRQFQEIKAGDLILDLAAAPVVSVYPGQGILSGVVPLDSLAGQSPKFSWGGEWYEPAQVGDELASAWDAIFAGVELHKTILLRRET